MWAAARGGRLWCFVTLISGEICETDQIISARADAPSENEDVEA